MKNMNKAELIEHIASAHTLTKAEAGRIVETLTSAIVNTVKKGGSVVIPGFGSQAGEPGSPHRREPRNRRKAQDRCKQGAEVHAWLSVQGCGGSEGGAPQGRHGSGCQSSGPRQEASGQEERYQKGPEGVMIEA